jgi:predicted dehydrogenase
VRWTEQRNIQAVLDLMGSNSLDVRPLISHRFPIDDAVSAYRLIETKAEPFLGIVLEFPPLESRELASTVQLRPRRPGSGKIRSAVIGAGNFARLVLLPAIQASGAFEIANVCSAKGLTAASEAQLVDAEAATTDADAIFDDATIDTVFSITRHDQHARHVLRAIDSGKNLFVEKPLCITLDELAGIEDALRQAGDAAPLIMVGFNRRFSPAAEQLKAFFSGVAAPLTLTYRFNAGEIPKDHWTQHDHEGGGRIIGEACHAMDLVTFLCGSPPVRVFAESVRDGQREKPTDDQCLITLRHGNGSVSSIGYFSGGDRGFPKERIEVFGGGRVGVIDDFRSVTQSHGGRTETTKIRQQKGHREEIAAFAQALRAQSTPPISWIEMQRVTLASILAVRSLREGTPFDF